MIKLLLGGSPCTFWSIVDKMGFTNVEYHAFEIDKFAIKVANHNYPDIIQHGDAFHIREWEV